MHVADLAGLGTLKGTLVKYVQKSLFEEDSADSNLMMTTGTVSVPELKQPGNSMVHELFRRGMGAKEIATLTGSSPLAVSKWRDGTGLPSIKQSSMLERAVTQGVSGLSAKTGFHSNGSRHRLDDYPRQTVSMGCGQERSPLQRITRGAELLVAGSDGLTSILKKRAKGAPTAATPSPAGVSAGKNTYTYDAHTYHTKVPPQGIAELLRHYLPEGGLVADPFGGSGMTAVAASIAGMDSVVNDLSPAASFIASRFASRTDPQMFSSAIRTILENLEEVRHGLYTTQCRECDQSTEILYTTWSYRVICSHCQCDFQLWDVVRSYGRTVREHKILREFPCPHCGEMVQKSRLKRTFAEPVQVGYKCCSSGRQESTAPPTAADLALIEETADLRYAARHLIPTDKFPNGVNLRQPIKHGIDSVDAIYTPRNLSALSRIWEETLRIDDDQLAAQVAFVFTSLYRRVSKFSEFRFWGGSGNAARLNVPYIYDESNVFISYRRKAQTILDHLQTTALEFNGDVAVTNGTATDWHAIPDQSVDLVFTDPPFGSNINYSDMNFIWEAWLRKFTDTTNEAIINKVQDKALGDYEQLMTASFSEAFRILRDKHWMLVVFMNSSAQVWESINRAIRAAGFQLVKADIFDKQHGTVKEFESSNTAGSDLVIHCFKDTTAAADSPTFTALSPAEFAESVDLDSYRQRYLHVDREEEFNYRRLYSEWLGQTLVRGGETALGFVEFKKAVRGITEP